MDSFEPSIYDREYVMDSTGYGSFSFYASGGVLGALFTYLDKMHMYNGCLLWYRIYPWGIIGDVNLFHRGITRITLRLK